MPVVHLTDLMIQRLPPADPHVTYIDQGMPNFGIRVGKRSRTFVVLKGNERKRISLGRYPALSLKDARRRAQTTLLGIHDPALSVSSAPPVSVLLEQFLRSQQSRNRPRTQRQTERILTRRLATFAMHPIDQLTSADLAAMIDEVARGAPAEANAIHAKISTFFNWCVHREIIPRNPLANIPKPAPITQRARVLSCVELAAVLKSALRIINTPYGAITLIIAFTGLRRNEAHTLTWPNITRDTITIPASIAKNHTELVLPNTINGYLASVPRTGEMLFPDNIRWHEALKSLHKLSATEGWTLHDLRRTLSTNMAEWEIAPPDVVEAILNHKSGSRSQIQRTYDRHTRLPQMRRALGAYADRLQALMKSQTTTSVTV